MDYTKIIPIFPEEWGITYSQPRVEPDRLVQLASPHGNCILAMLTQHLSKIL